MFRKLLIDFPPTPPVAASPPSYRMYTPGARQARANDTPSTRHVQAKHTAAMPPEAAPPLASAHGVTLAAISMQEPFGSLLRQNRRPGWPRGPALQLWLSGRGCRHPSAAAPGSPCGAVWCGASVLGSPFCGRLNLGEPPCDRHRLTADAWREDGGVARTRHTRRSGGAAARRPHRVQLLGGASAWEVRATASAPNPNPNPINPTLTLILTLIPTLTP